MLNRKLNRTAATRHTLSTRASLVAAVFALTASMACDTNIVIGGNGSGMPMENTLDGVMDGTVWDTPVDGAVDRSYGGMEMGMLWANLERQSERGVMTYLSIFTEDDDGELQGEPGVVYGSSTTSDEAPILDAEGNQFFRIDDEDATQTTTPEDVYVSAGECDGPNVDSYEEDREFENVAYVMEDCEECDDETAQTVRFMAWNAGESRRVTGRFNVGEDNSGSEVQNDINTNETIIQ